MPRRKPAAKPPTPILAYVEPRYDYTKDVGEGGVKQVIGHVVPYLEALGVEFVDDREAADVIWYHAAPYAQTRTWLEKHPEVAVVDSCHGAYWAEYDWDRGSLSANAEVIEGMRLADVVTAPSQWVANAINRGISADVRVVYHGVDMAEFASSAVETADYALYDKTRVDPVCSPEPVIALAHRMPDQKFVLTGDPPVDLPNVLKLGRIPYEQARELTLGAGLYLAVTRETFGLATLQAMAAGVPVVGYDFGGQSEFVGAGGILVPPGDIDALAAAVGEAQRDRARLSQAARDIAATFTWERAAREYYRAFEDAIAAHASTVRCTVITAAYNAERTIARTVQSALAAMGPDDEYIIVDDASTDKTHEKILLAIMGRNDKGTIRIINRAENGYLAQARNDALRVARGRYVTCLDADDELMPDALDVLAGELDCDRTIQVAYGKLRFVDDVTSPTGEVTSSPADYGHGPGVSPWPPEFDVDAQLAATNFSPMPYSAMIRRPWLERSGGWRTRCRTGEDLDLWMRLVSYGARPRRVTEAAVLTYHTSNKSMSATNPLPDWGKWYPWTGAAGKRVTPPWGLPVPPDTRAMNSSWPVSHHAEPRVSVIIPVGPGHERYVLDAVDSVNAQTYRRWECVVVNDTGHDLGVRMPGWVKLTGGKPGTGGASSARNAGLRAATAPYVVFLDADDILDRDALEHLVETMDRNPQVAVVYPDYWLRSQVDAPNGRIDWEYRPNPLPDWDCVAGAKPGAVYSVTAIYRRAAIDAVGGFDEDAPGWEDGDLQVALTYAGYCAAHLPRRAFIYSLTQSSGKRENDLSREPEVVAWFQRKYAGREPMACGTCGGTPNRVSSPIMDAGGDAVVLSGGMTEVQYTGPMQGSFTLRGGQSGAYYVFDAGRNRNKAVLDEDLAFFEASPEYLVLREGSPQAPDAMPSLQVDGPPRGRRAAVA